MERNTERKTLSFSKGMTNVPSDLLSEDSELLESVGFIYKDGEMKPVQEPVHVTGNNRTILYVHKTSGYKNIVSWVKDKDAGWINIWIYKEDSWENIDIFGTDDVVNEVYSVTSVGNTLVCTTDKGIRYLLFKGGEYKDLGTELPKPKLIPQLTTTNYLALGGLTVCSLGEIIDSTDKYASYDSSGNLTELFDARAPDRLVNYFQYSVKNDVDKIQSFKDATIGHYSAVLQKIKERNYFSFPFFIRYALKLYDGTYARISAPILLFPTISKNCRFVPMKYKDSNWAETAEKTTYFNAYIGYSTLQFKAQIDNIDNWSDIVKELVVFASDDVKPFYLEDGFEFARATDVNGKEFMNWVNSDFKYKVDSGLGGGITVEAFKPVYTFQKDSYPAREVLVPKNYKTDAIIKEELLSKSQFYKLFSVKTDNSNYIQTIEFKNAPIGRSVVENLVTQEQLKTDDYYGWTKLTAKKSFAYNKRINLFDVARYPFEGFNDLDMYYPYWTSNGKFSYYTHIVSEGMNAWVISPQVDVFYTQAVATWLYYPDPNATEMIIWNNTTNKGMKVKLLNHPMLNGAYYFGNLPTTESFVSENGVSLPKVDNTACEVLDSQIFTSVVNNPFVFEASGDNTVGTGKILGIMANTQAISQGQFGQYPLIVFTSEGIYGMSVTSEGLYSASYPISRDVPLENSPFVPTDNFVIFVSKKGLMATTGGQVVCLSNQLCGKINKNSKSVFGLSGISLFDILKDCVVAYDYRDSLLRIYKRVDNKVLENYDENGNYAKQDDLYYYIYNMVDKTFSLQKLKDSPVIAAINDYPDNLIQTDDYNIYSLTSKPNINDDENSYSGTIITRPLKLGGSMTLKSLRNIKNLKSTQTGKLQLEIWGSNNAVNWCKLHSLGGKPWSYFTFKYTLTDFKACDSFAGSIVDVQNRRELK